jgi:Mn-containing catalase
VGFLFNVAHYAPFDSSQDWHARPTSGRSAALESMEKPPSRLELSSRLQAWWTNTSTVRREKDEGETDHKGPWNEKNGLHLVDSELMDGDGLTTAPYAPQPGTEITSPVDSTPVGVDIGQRGSGQKGQRAAQNKDASKRNKEKLAS